VLLTAYPLIRGWDIFQVMGDVGGGFVKMVMNFRVSWDSPNC